MEQKCFALVNIQKMKKKQNTKKQTNLLWCDGIYGVFGRVTKKKKNESLSLFPPEFPALSEKKKSVLYQNLWHNTQKKRDKLRIPFCEMDIYLDEPNQKLKKKDLL